MATYYDSHDSRSRHSRRHDPFSHSNKTTAGSSSSQSYSRHTDDRHEPRRHHASLLEPETGRTSSHRRSLSRTRRAWPPHPYAEDEEASLRREAGGLGRIRDARARAEVPCRGTIDQEQLIVDVYGSGRGLHAGSDRMSSSAGIPTPPTSEDERARKSKRRPSRINTDVGYEVPEMNRRTASPYAFTKDRKPRQEPASSDTFLSPNNPIPASSNTTGRRVTTSASGSRPSSPRSDSGRLSPGSRRGRDYFTSSYAANESAIDDSDQEHLSGRGGGTGYSSKSNTSGPSPRSSVVDFAASNPHTPSSRTVSTDARRNTDNQGNFPPLTRSTTDRLRKPHNDLYDQGGGYPPPIYSKSFETAPKSREASYSTSRATSPTNFSNANSGTPPRSPRMSVEIGSRDPSNAGSRAASVSGSRPSSPSPGNSHDSPRPPRSEIDWGAALAANAMNTAKRSKPPSRLASSMRQESVPDLSHRNRDEAAPSQAASLPYPEDDSPFIASVSMPSERDHQFFGVPSAVPPQFHDHKAPVPASPSTAASTKTPLSPGRPTLHRGYSTSVVSPPGESKPPPALPQRPDSKPDTFASSSQAKKDLAAMLKKGMPSCARPEPVAGYDDWYTVIGAPNLDFCPDCVDSIFERTMFRPSFRRAPPRSLNTRVQCALGMPWLRIAWLLTLQQQRADLNLLKDLVDIDHSGEACPGNVEGVRTWYGLRDPEGLFVRDFHICYADVRKIERLLPSLTGLFVRLPQRASTTKRVCALRPEGNRFSTYLDAMISTHEKGQLSSSSSSTTAAAPSSSTATPTASSPTSTRRPVFVDPMPLIDLVERKTRLRECARDTMLLGAQWHLAAGMPALTVCEDCFDSVVAPAARRGSAVALRFARTVAPAPAEGRLGSSCQLYSRRMRKAFRRAVDDDDLKYLARKAKERRENEVRLQERYRDVLRRAKRLSSDVGGGGGSGSGSGGGSHTVGAAMSADDERKLNKELERISEEWKEMWE